MTNEAPSPEADPASKKRRPFLIPGIILAVVLGTWAWVRTVYPYGPSHCESDVIAAALLSYATNHDGWFPHGGMTPEASLSMLCKTDPTMLARVRGKNVSLKIAQAAWDKDGQLGPDSCGWNYVEGLRVDDDPRLGIVWDKPLGLDRYGERQHGLAHEVIYLDGSTGLISLEQWQDFVMEERAKLEKIRESRAKSGVPIRWTDEVFLGTNNPAR